MEREWKFEFGEYLELANEYLSYAKDDPERKQNKIVHRCRI
jgi:hypothetical protein